MFLLVHIYEKYFKIKKKNKVSKLMLRILGIVICMDQGQLENEARNFK